MAIAKRPAAPSPSGQASDVGPVLVLVGGIVGAVMIALLVLVMLPLMLFFPLGLMGDLGFPFWIFGAVMGSAAVIGFVGVILAFRGYRLTRSGRRKDGGLSAIIGGVLLLVGMSVIGGALALAGGILVSSKEQ